LNFRGQGIFKDTGVPFIPLANPITGKPNKALKDEYDNLITTIKQFNTTNFEGTHIYTNSGADITVDLRTVNALPQTFKFLGMDVTENLGVFIKGSYISVYVGNLINPSKLKFATVDSTVAVAPTLYPNLMKVLTPDTVKITIERLKHENFMTLDTSYSNPTHMHNNTESSGYDFLDPIVDLMQKGVTENIPFLSVTLNYISGSFLKVTTADASEKDINTYVYETLLGYWNGLLDRYKQMSALLSAYSLFFDVLKRAFSYDKVAESIKLSLTQGSFGDIGCFEGFAKGGIIQGRQMSCDIADSLLSGISTCKSAGFATYDFPARIYATTMFDYPNTVDVSSLNLTECVSYSILDTLKFVDKDLELVTNTYDMNNSEEREVFLKSTIKCYKKKFENYTKDTLGIGNEKSISNTIINNILPKDEASVDILNVNKTVDGTPQNIDVEVSRVSFNKTNLLKACHLIGKVLDMLKGNFAPNKP
jgi:hypothetical protein